MEITRKCSTKLFPFFSGLFKFDSIATKSECVNDLLVTVFTNWETITAIQAISF